MLRPNMIKVGGEVDALCSKCELTLAHTVIAMVGQKPAKVKCNTCHGEHRYRPPAGTAAAAGSVAKKKASRPPREKKILITFEEMLAARKRTPVPYSLKRRFVVDDVVDHPTFGRGFVSAVRIDKIDVTFSAEPRVLVHGRI
jgi:hypothetical protein